MADVASRGRSEDVAKLEQGLTSSDSAVRYWAAMGFLNQQPQDVQSALPMIERALEDPSPCVRIQAAEVMGKLGSDEDARQARDLLLPLADLQAHDLYIALLALNALDQIHDRAPLRESQLKSLPSQRDGLPGRLTGYVPRLLERLATRSLADQ